MIQPAGLGGSPSAGQRATARAKASWTASSAMSMSPNTRTRTDTARPYSARKIRSTSRPGAGAGPGASASVGAPGVCLAVPPSCLAAPRAPLAAAQWPHLTRQGGDLRDLPPPLQRGVQVGHADHGEPAHVLLAFGERAVGHDHVTVLGADHGGRAGGMQPAGEHPRPGGLQVLTPGLDLL